MRAPAALIAALVWTCCAAFAPAQDIEPRASASILLVTQPAGAEIWLGDSLLGTAPMTLDTAVARRASIFYPARKAWNPELHTLGDTLVVSRDGVVRVLFAERVRILSSPSGAEVMDGDSLLGRTPCELAPRSGRVDFVVRHPGYRSARLHVDAGESEAAYVVLERDAATAASGVVDLRTTRFTLPPARILVPAGIGLAAGVAAVILKQAADSEYARYTATLEQSLLDRTRKYDVLAGISIGILEVCVGYFVALLLMDH